MFPQIFGKYVLEREIGAGGMARVYLATLRGAGGFEKRLVVKQIRAELASDAAFVKRFVEEAKTAVELSHPNIVPVYELGVEQGVYYIAMELCEGSTLIEVLERTGPLDPHEGAYVAVEICRALGYAHRRAGIVHRDVTPRNVLIDDEGAVRLIDFGIAAPVRGEGPVEIFGSPGHMPPEQLQGAELSPATDVFAVGALLIEAWTGKPPFRRSSPADCVRALHEPLPPLDDVLGELAALSAHVASCVALSAKERPQSADDAARPLREFLKTADLGDVARRLGERVRRARAPASAAAAASATEPSTRAQPEPSMSAPETRTFAVRDELSVWTRPIEHPVEAPPPGPERPESGPSTRRLSQAPERLSRPPSGARRRRVWPWVGVATLIGSTGLAWTALRSPPVTAPPPQPTSAAAPGASSSSAAAPAPPVLPPLPSASTPSPAPPRPADSSQPPTAAVARSAPITSTSGTLRITSDPPAVVAIDGEGVHETRTTPVRGLNLRPGSYRVTFRSETYGAPVAAPVTIAVGATRTIHADFRQVDPRVTVR